MVPITSNVATLTVTAVQIITIKTQPTDQTIYANQTTSFPSFAVTVDNIEGVQLTYQWYSNTTNSATGAVAIEGATNASYSIKQSDIGNVGSKKYYYVVISGSINGASLGPVNSNIVSLTTQADSTITITTQPTAEQIVAKDASVTLNVTANSTATTNVLAYQWQKANSDAAVTLHEKIFLAQTLLHIHLMKIMIIVQLHTIELLLIKKEQVLQQYQQLLKLPLDTQILKPKHKWMNGYQIMITKKTY